MASARIILILISVQVFSLHFRFRTVHANEIRTEQKRKVIVMLRALNGNPERVVHLIAGGKIYIFLLFNGSLDSHI